MTSMQLEKFFGPDPALTRAVINLETGKFRTLIGAVMLVVVVVAMGFGGDALSEPVRQFVPAAVLILGLCHLIGGPLQILMFRSEAVRLTTAPPPGVLWYSINEEGLVVHTDMKLDLGAGGLVVPWAAMETLTRPEGANPVLTLTYRLAAAAKPAVLSLGTDRKRADGVSFGDRMQARFDTRGAGVPTPVSQGARTMACRQTTSSTEALADLTATWRAQPAAGRWAMILGVCALSATLAASGLGLLDGKQGEAEATGRPASTTAPLATSVIPDNPKGPVFAYLDGPSKPSTEQGEPDPAGVLRRIAAGNRPLFDFEVSRIGILEEQPIDSSGPRAGRTAQFEWKRRAATWTTITVFGFLQQAELAYEQLSGGETRDILMPSPDGVTQYVRAVVSSSDESRRFQMRCAARPKLLYCSIVPDRVPAIVTVKLRSDTEAGPEPGASKAKGAELSEAMGRETDDVMRSLKGLSLDGRRVVAR